MLWRGGMQPCERKLRLYGQSCAALGNSWQAPGPAADGRRGEHSRPRSKPRRAACPTHAQDRLTTLKCRLMHTGLAGKSNTP